MDKKYTIVIIPFALIFFAYINLFQGSESSENHYYPAFDSREQLLEASRNMLNPVRIYEYVYGSDIKALVSSSLTSSYDLPLDFSGLLVNNEVLLRRDEFIAIGAFYMSDSELMDIYYTISEMSPMERYNYLKQLAYIFSLSQN